MAMANAMREVNATLHDDAWPNGEDEIANGNGNNDHVAEEDRNRDDAEWQLRSRAVRLPGV